MSGDIMKIVKPKKENETDEFKIKPNLKRLYGKNWRVLSRINKNTRTVNCECGSVKLNILSKSGKVDYKCSECGKYVETVDQDEYETNNSECKKCNGDNFTVIVTEKEENTESWISYCTNCGEKAKELNIDRETK
jgi:DNA-directed RNA polymerase subunit RPC12/RpoP